MSKIVIDTDNHEQENSRLQYGGRDMNYANFKRSSSIFRQSKKPYTPSCGKDTFYTSQKSNFFYKRASHVRFDSAVHLNNLHTNGDNSPFSPNRFYINESINFNTNSGIDLDSVTAPKFPLNSKENRLEEQNLHLFKAAQMFKQHLHAKIKNRNKSVVYLTTDSYKSSQIFNESIKMEVQEIKQEKPKKSYKKNISEIDQIISIKKQQKVEDLIMGKRLLKEYRPLRNNQVKTQMMIIERQLSPDKRNQMIMKIKTKKDKQKFAQSLERGINYYSCLDKIKLPPKFSEVVSEGSIKSHESCCKSPTKEGGGLKNRKSPIKDGVIEIMDRYLRIQSPYQEPKKAEPQIQQPQVIEEENQKIKKFGRFRFLVAKHFLSKSLEEIDNNPNKIDMSQVVKLHIFQKTLDELFPDDSKFSNLGMKYSNMNENLYKNFYMRERQYVLQDFNIEDKLAFISKIQNNQSYLNDLNIILRSEYYQKLYFEQAARTQTKSKCNQIEQTLQFQTGMLKKQQEFINENEIICFMENVAYIREKYINNNLAIAIQNTFSQISENCQFRIDQLVIEACQISDENIAIILEGAGQIQTLVINNTQINKKSFEVILSLIPSLRVLKLNNIKFYRPQLLKTIFEKGNQLQVLKLSNINLNCKFSIALICQNIKEDKFFHTLELSNSNLQPKDLFTIAKTLKIMTQHLKVLDLSYNTLVREGLESYAISFMDMLSEYLRDTDMLNHLNLSGLQLKYIQNGAKFTDLAQSINQCSNLLAVHLSDNDLIISKERSQMDPTGGLLEEFEYFEEVLNIFRLRYTNVFAKKKPKKQFQYAKDVKQARIEQMDQTGYGDRKLFAQKRQFLLDKQFKFVQNRKTLNESLTFGAVARVQSQEVFILNRSCTNPELIYAENGYKFDQPFRWQFVNQCKVCLKHTYSLIQFDQSQDNDLYEITDPAVLDSIKSEVSSGPLSSPYILGSFCPGSRMLRSDYFTLLSLGQTIRFVKRTKEFKSIKNGIQTILEMQTKEEKKPKPQVDFVQKRSSISIINRLKGVSTTEVFPKKKDKTFKVQQNPNILKKIEGWQQLMEDKCTKNELEDILKINYHTPSETCFSFAGFLSPGYHWFIIYCPIQNRAFCKELIVDLNNSLENFPELPKQIGAKNMKEPTPNVWNPWKETNRHDKNLMINSDIKSELFQIESRCTSPEQCKEIIDVIKKHWKILQTIRFDAAILVDQYPYLSIKEFQSLTEKISENQMTEQQVEQLFKKASKDQPMGRGQFLEAMVRYFQMVTKGKKNPENFEQFINHFLKPVCDQSEIQIQRAKFRASEKLSWLLHHNKNQLKEIYLDYKSTKQGFGIEEADLLLNTAGVAMKKTKLVTSMATSFQKLLQSETGLDLKSGIQKSMHTGQFMLINSEDLIKCFRFSKMATLDESRYNRLVYIEFVEMLCRVAATVGPNGTYYQGVEVQVYQLFKILFQRRYEIGRDTKETLPLKELIKDQSDDSI